MEMRIRFHRLLRLVGSTTFVGLCFLRSTENANVLSSV